MKILLIKTKDGRTYEGRQPLHFMVAEQHGINPEDVEQVGFITRDREVWDNRKPH